MSSILNISEQEVINRLKNIVKTRFSIDLNQYTDNDLTKELLGDTFHLTSACLIYLFFDIEREFNIIIPEEDIAAGKFNSFSNVIDIIKNQLCIKAAVKESHYV